MALRSSFARDKFTYSTVAFFPILRESSKRLAILREICMWLNGYFMSSADVVRHRRPPPSSPSVVRHINVYANFHTR